MYIFIYILYRYIEHDAINHAVYIMRILQLAITIYCSDFAIYWLFKHQYCDAIITAMGTFFFHDKKKINSAHIGSCLSRYIATMSLEIVNHCTVQYSTYIVFPTNTAAL